MKDLAWICIGLSLICLSTKPTASLEVSLRSPAWKHCVHRMHASIRRWSDFQSDNYPNGITKQTQCSWIISVNSNQKLILSFFHLNLTGTMPGGCFTQYMQIYELDTGQLLPQRFCGNRRPGDYVSYGKTLRVDLLADTVAEPHQGFRMMVKATNKLKPGFKKTFSFPAPKPPKSKKKQKKKKKGVKSTSAVSPPPPAKNGGKVDLRQMQLSREQARRQLFNTTRVQPKAPPKRPDFVQNPPVFTHSGNPKPVDEIEIALSDDDDSLDFNLYMVIGIAGGGLILLIIIGILFKICVYDKRKPKNKREATETEKKTPLEAVAHPIQRRHDLPGQMMTSPVSTLRQQTYGAYNHAPEATSHSNDYQPSHAKRNALDVINNDVITQNGVPGMLMPVDGGGYMFYCPPESDVNTLTSQGRVLSLKNRETSPFDDEGYGTARTLGQRTKSGGSEKRKKKKVPTLKRKLSEWEKQEIRKGTLHI